MEEISTTPNTRLASLDVFRGLTVAAMILVNNPGDWGNIYGPLKHAHWHGCTPTDLIFPFFLFIVGVSIALSLGNKRAQGVYFKNILMAILKRGAILFALGLILALFPDVFFEPIKSFSTLRIPGVLQRIAIVFVVCAILFYKTGPRTQTIHFFTILILYWILMTFVPVPGFGQANLEAETNLGAWLDRTILSESHLWKQSITWDPEGILSTLPSVGNGIAGLLAGTLLRRIDLKITKKISLLLIAGSVLTLAGFLWSFSFPLNKALWTSSYVLYTSGLAILMLTAFYYLIDVKQQKWFTIPFMVYGVNAITVFFLSGIIAKTMNFIKVNGPEGEPVSLKTMLFKSYFVPNFTPLNASLAWALSFVSFWLIVMYIMHKRKVYIKV
jgi:predicted acyltransferase